MKRVLLLLALCLQQAALGQGVVATPLRISEYRSGNPDTKAVLPFRGATLDIDFSGELVAGATEVDRVVVDLVVDNLGNRTTGPAPQARRFRQLSGFSRNGIPLRGTAQFPNLSRDATVIRQIDGMVTLLTTSEATGTIVRVPRIASLTGSAIRSPALEKNGVSIEILTRKQFEERGISDFAGADTPNSEARMRINFDVGVVLYVKDPENRLALIEMKDGAGKPLSFGMSSGRVDGAGGRICELLPREPMPADAEVVLHLATTESLSSHRFRFENLPLP